MFIAPLRFRGPIKNLSGAIAITSNNVGHIVTGIGRMLYSSDKESKSCKDVPQTEGRRVEPWPQPEQPSAPCRNECHREPQSPNYDPYRIKVPEVVVPPLPPTDAKLMLLTTDKEQPGQQQVNQQGYQRSYQQGYPQRGYGPLGQPQDQEAEEKDESFMGRIRGFFDKIKGKSKRTTENMTSC